MPFLFRGHHLNNLLSVPLFGVDVPDHKVYLRGIFLDCSISDSTRAIHSLAVNSSSFTLNIGTQRSLRTISTGAVLIVPPAETGTCRIACKEPLPAPLSAVQPPFSDPLILVLFRRQPLPTSKILVGRCSFLGNWRYW